MERLAAMGGAYGNLAALAACLDDAAQWGAEWRAFLGDAIGCCGHSEEVVAAVRSAFDVLVAGNHEQQAFARSESCGCGYSTPEDEEISCEAFRLATADLSSANADWLGTWPERAIVELAGGSVLLCHGSPGHTSEFLYEVELDDLRLEAWLDHFGVRGFICTHSGLPWVRRLSGGRFALNCGVVGKPDHDGDAAVHYARVELPAHGEPMLEIRRVSYDHESWARRMEARGIAPVFVEPVRTGVWTSGVASLPAAERHRPQRRKTSSSWRPEILDVTAFHNVLATARDAGVITSAERNQVHALFDPAFPYFAALRLANSVHLHIKVDDVAAIPSLGGRPENGREGYIKYAFDGGINLIYSSIPTSEEDTIPTALPDLPPRPYLDHLGIDLRRETGLVRATVDDVPSLARRAGWAHKGQGGTRPVFCCHAMVAEKHWVYPPPGARWTRPIELAYGKLVISQEMNGCDLRPIDPRHPSAGFIAACVPSQHSADKEAVHGG